MRKLLKSVHDWLVTFHRTLLLRLKGYRTVIIAAFIALYGVLEQSNLVPLVPAAYQPLAAVAIPAIFAVMRALTTTRLGSKVAAPVIVVHADDVPHPGDCP